MISGPAGTPRQWRRDSTLYCPGAMFVSTSERDGKTQTMIMTAEEYRQLVNASFLRNGFIEVDVGSREKRFGDVAQVHSVFEGRRTADGPVIARGVNLYMLYWDGTRWWSTGMVWHDERPANRIPKEWIGLHDSEP